MSKQLQLSSKLRIKLRVITDQRAHARKGTHDSVESIMRVNERRVRRHLFETIANH